MRFVALQKQISAIIQFGFIEAKKCLRLTAKTVNRIVEDALLRMEVQWLSLPSPLPLAAKRRSEIGLHLNLIPGPGRMNSQHISRIDAHEAPCRALSLPGTAHELPLHRGSHRDTYRYG